MGKQARPEWGHDVAPDHRPRHIVVILRDLEGHISDVQKDSEIEPLNFALARPPPAAICADFCSRGPVTQIGDMPLFLLLWPGFGGVRHWIGLCQGKVASPQLEIPTTPQRGAHASCLESSMRQ